MHNLFHLSLHQMESAISIRYCPFPYGSKGFQFQIARPSRIHLRFNHATPFCLPQISTTTHHVTPSFRHANCMLERVDVPSKNEGKSCNKILSGVTAASLVLACVLGLFTFSAKINPKLTPAYAGTFTHDIGKIEVKGSSALKELFNMSDTEPSTVSDKETTSDPPSENDVRKLKKAALGRSKSEALNTLNDYYKKYKNYPAERRYIGFALVEVYMSQGDSRAALKLLDELIRDELLAEGQKLTPDQLLKNYKDAIDVDKLAIAQCILYKAIVHGMKKEKDAKEWWQKFIEIY